MKHLFDIDRAEKAPVEPVKPINQEKACLYFGAGLFLGAQVVRFPMVADAWQIEFRLKGGGRTSLSVARSEKIRIFKTLDSAFKVARLIGFRDVLIIGG